jgi:hypothetical protein
MGGMKGPRDGIKQRPRLSLTRGLFLSLRALLFSSAGCELFTMPRCVRLRRSSVLIHLPSRFLMWFGPNGREKAAKEVRQKELREDIGGGHGRLLRRNGGKTSKKHLKMFI